MALTLYLHPLASFCHKVLIALYENDTPFTAHTVDFSDAEANKAFLERWPVGKIPLLYDARQQLTLPETSIIIEYLDQHYPGQTRFLPADPAAQLQARLWDRFFDLYVQVPMQKIVADRLRPEGGGDVLGVADAHANLRTAYNMIEQQMADKAWAIGNRFSLADCAAAPALFYASIVEPFPASHRNLTAYFERLLKRRSFERVLEEARPWFKLFPFKEAIPKRFLDDE
ncbi:glutathione S-transferase family protein [Pseudomonas sp. R5(2019)]|uniref:glutathione S-transferase family protein n=1 Tax=Pseudomonas sp. R5(2019) TaxID=2697566 RepID=UPI0014128AC2|nr:glutathione S-transferase family protein [Pseudomonas sp. R5(2019)]NBA95970.1 glutathione S-transferase family protein [Pseudomonas sp. R5(2019)]